ncbi:MAG: hypothetical protein IJZ10_04585, partial [Thermoguttaceae bacterium]|nr:hypothetical protein [Thermoguttaceae bacterium]
MNDFRYFLYLPRLNAKMANDVTNVGDARPKKRNFLKFLALRKSGVLTGALFLFTIEISKLSARRWGKPFERRVEAIIFTLRGVIMKTNVKMY